MQDLLLLNEVIYRPIFNFLVLFLELTRGNLGLAIILLTVLIRALMIKQTSAGNNMQQGMGDMQPKLQEIQEKYKDDPKRLSQETMKVFKTKGKGPLKGCLMMLIQIPVFIGLFYVIRHFAAGEVGIQNLYSFFYSFGQKYLSLDHITTNFLGMDLLKGGKEFATIQNQNLYLAIFAAVFTYLQMKLTTLVKPAQTPSVPGAKVPDMSKMMWFMGVFMAFIMGSFVFSMQAGVGLYIATTTLFSSTQYLIQYRTLLTAKLKATLAGKGWKKKPQIIEKK